MDGQSIKVSDLMINAKLLSVSPGMAVGVPEKRSFGSWAYELIVTGHLKCPKSASSSSQSQLGTLIEPDLTFCF
jgi:hypothetical protein